MKIHIFLFLVLFSFQAISQDLITDRPDQTESSSTLPKRYFQIETGTLIDINESTNTWLIQSNLFRYGVTDDLEFRLVTELEKHTNRASQLSVIGINDTQFGIKYRFLKSAIEIAYLGHIFIPNGTNEFSASKVGSSQKILISHGITESISAGYNIGYDYFDSDRHGITYSFVLGFGLTDKIAFFSEVYGEWLRVEDFIVNYDHGFTYAFKSNLQFDFSMGFGITEQSNFYSVGLSWRLPN